ncbi:MAG: hypothetical protein LBI30_01320 [Holosporales bacterium]|jgi:hypothetical protein|nr:hypothetical protein [Holosporales bacterium]
MRSVFEIGLAHKVFAAAVCSGLCFILPLLADSWVFTAAIISLFAPLPLMIVGLQYGYISCLKSAIVALIVVSFGSVHFSLQYIVYNAVPTVILIFMATQSKKDGNGKTWWCPEERLLSYLTACSVLISVFFNYTNSAQIATTSLFGESSSLFSQNEKLRILHSEASHVIYNLIPLLNGIKGFTWAMLMAINIWAAQKVLEKTDLPALRPKLRLINVHLSAFNKWFFLVSLLLTVAVGFNKIWHITANALVLAFFPVFLNGLGVLSFIATGKGWILIVGLILFTGPVLAIALAGLVDGFWNVRYSLKKRLD